MTRWAGGAASSVALLAGLVASVAVTAPAAASSTTSVVAQVRVAAAPAVTSLAALVFPTARVGYAAGVGALLATRDGGRTWVTLPSPLPSVAALAFASAQDGYALGVGRLVATADGGRTWQPRPRPPRPLVTLSVVPGLVYATTDASPGRDRPGPLLVSRDGARAWRALATPVPAQAACFADPQTGWILGATGSAKAPTTTVFGTADAGRTWQPDLTVSLPAGAMSPGSGTLACAPSGRVWAEISGGQGMSALTSAVWASADTGRTWRELAATHPGASGPPPGPARHLPSVPGSSPGPMALAADGSGYVLGICAACSEQTYQLGGSTRGQGWHDAGAVGTPGVATGPLAGFAVTAPGVAEMAIDWDGDLPEILQTRDAGRTWRVLWRA